MREVSVSHDNRFLIKEKKVNCRWVLALLNLSLMDPRFREDDERGL
jgi:hypothetical protein